MLHERLLELVVSHTQLLDEALRRGIDWSDMLQVYGVLHALQLQAQAAIDYLLHTCALVGVAAETPIRCTEKLKGQGLLKQDEAELLKKVVRFRNVVVHEYAEIDLEKIRVIMEKRLYHKTLETLYKLHNRLVERGLVDP